MKAKMKKLQLLVFYRDKEKVTQQLEKLGMVHVEVDQEASNQNLQLLEKQQQSYVKALSIIESKHRETIHLKNTIYPSVSAQKLKEYIISLKQQIETYKQQKDKKEKTKKLLQPWGNFKWSNIKLLGEKGIQTYFYSAHLKQFEKLDFKQLSYAIINRTNNKIYFVIFAKSKPEIPVDHIVLPDLSLQDVQTDLQETEVKISTVEKKLEDLQYLEGTLKEAISETEFAKFKSKVNLSYQQFAKGKVLLLKGWFLEGSEEEITDYLQKHKLSFKVSKPAPTDKVPVLLKNKAYPKLFESITRLFQLPHYYEMDLTPFIAVFYPIFFAYCLGDSGYGLILLSAAVAGWFTFLKTSRNIALLGMVLGALTMLMGVVKSGSIFGMAILENTNIPLFNYLSAYVFIPDDQSFVFNAFNVALLIGLFQLLFAVVLSALKKWYYFSFKHALFPFGKLLIMLGAIGYFLGSMQGVTFLQPYVYTAKLLLLSGVLIVIFFHDTEMSIIQRTGSSVLPLFFIFTGLLGDTLSYVRLFALGVSSSVLGLVVNQIGMQMMGGFAGTIFAVLFLLFGHSLNFLLAALGAFVHPLRLTFVEFYNNVEFEGGGDEFKPFKSPDHAAIQH